MSDEAFSAWFDALYTRYASDIIRVSYFYRPALEPGHEKTWLLKVAMNRCRDIWRSAWVRRVISGSPAFEMIPAPDTLGKHMEKAEVLQAVHSLPADFREIFILYYYQGYGISEISGILNLPEGTISSRLSRGRKKLEAILGEERGESA